MAEAKVDDETQQKFNMACFVVKNGDKPPSAPSNDKKLKMYSFYKQATIGNVNTARPGMFDLTGKAKWDAWKKIENTSTGDAMKGYIGEMHADWDKDKCLEVRQDEEILLAM